MNKVFLSFLTLILSCIPCFAMYIDDDIANLLPNDVAKPVIHNIYNYESTVKLPILLKIVNPISSETDVYEGQKIKFKVMQTVSCKDEIIVQKGDLIESIISVIIPSGMNGIPASIIFSDFKLCNELKDIQFSNSYEVFGQDRSLLVFPLKWALTFLPPTGSLTNFIKGGHVKLKKNKVITIYCYPDWK